MRTKTKKEIEEEIINDDNLLDALTDTSFENAVRVYRGYVGKSETPEERQRRIQRFRCGGR